MSRTKKTEIPMWAKTGHAKPVSRREFLAAGLIPFSASMIMPNWMKLLLPEGAYGANCPMPATDLMPFITLNLAGGAGLAGNYVPCDQGLNPLTNLSLTGLGKNPPITREFGNVPFAGSLTTGGPLIGKFLEGVRETAPTALAKTAFVATCVRSRDDSSENKFSVDGMLSKAGLAGTLLPNLGRRNDSTTGIGQEPAAVAPPAPLIVSSFNSITSSLGYAGAVGGNVLKPTQRNALAKLIANLSETQTRKLASISSGTEVKSLLDCAGIKNQDLVAAGTNGVDPRSDSTAGAQISTIWNINTNTGAGDQNLIFSSMAYNALKNQSGSVALEMGGYDYHDNTRTTGDGRDLNAGRVVGRLLETAAAMNKPLFLYVTSDGATSSAMSDTPDSVWTSDRGTAGLTFMLYFNPAGRPETSSHQIGWFTTGQAADEKFPTGNSPEAAAAAAFANYLAINKRLDLYAGIANRALDAEQLSKVIKFS